MLRGKQKGECILPGATIRLLLLYSPGFDSVYKTQMHKELGLCHVSAVVASDFTAEEQTPFWIGEQREVGWQAVSSRMSMNFPRRTALSVLCLCPCRY